VRRESKLGRFRLEPIPSGRYHAEDVAHLESGNI